MELNFKTKIITKRFKFKKGYIDYKLIIDYKYIYTFKGFYKLENTENWIPEERFHVSVNKTFMEHYDAKKWYNKYLDIDLTSCR